MLRKVVAESELISWRDIGGLIGAGEKETRDRYLYLTSVNNFKAASTWKPEEDAKLMELVKKNGARNFHRFLIELPGHTYKQCWERYNLHLDPTIRKEPWTNMEDLTVMKLYMELGSKWSKIRESLQGRTAT